MADIDNFTEDSPEDSPDGSIAPSASNRRSIPPPSSTSSHGGRAKIDAIWTHARQPRRGEPPKDQWGHTWFYCKYCSSKSASVKNARKHLAGSHLLRIEKASNQTHMSINRKRTIDGIFREQEARQEGRQIEREQHLLAAIDKKAYREALAQLITNRDLPLRFAAYPELGALIHSVNCMADSVVQTSEYTLPNIIRQAYVLHRSIVKSRLLNALSKIHFNIDMWTAENNSAFQAITAHFADGELLQLQKALISLKEFKGSHGGEEQAVVFLQCLNQYEIQPHKLGYITMDNATSNDKLLQAVQREIPTFDASERRIRCNGHIINLAVQAFLFGQDDQADVEAESIENLTRIEGRGEDRIQTAAAWRKLGVLGRLHNLNISMRSSSSRYQDFVKAAGRSIPRDNMTRWNSWYDQIHVTLKPRIRQAILQYQDQYHSDVKDDVINPEAWIELKELHNFLEPFKQVTLDTEGDRCTLDRVLTNMDYLSQHYQTAMDQYRSKPTLLARIITSLNKFDKYYQKTDKHAVYAAAVLLHPSLRKDYLSTEAGWKQGDIDKAIKRVRQLWLKEYKQDNVQEDEDEENPHKAWQNKIYGSKQRGDEFESFYKVDNVVLYEI
jgi:hypothetical protein